MVVVAAGVGLGDVAEVGTVVGVGAAVQAAARLTAAATAATKISRSCPR